MKTIKCVNDDYINIERLTNQKGQTIIEMEGCSDKGDKDQSFTFVYLTLESARELRNHLINLLDEETREREQ